MHYSRRVAAWLYRLNVSLVKKCGSFAELEMISFWLLCLKLLRATTGIKRGNGNELSEGCSHTQNQRQKEQEYFPGAVTIETSSLSEMATVNDNKMESMETEMTENEGSQGEEEKACIQTDIEDSIKTEDSVELSEDLSPDEDGITELKDLGNGDENFQGRSSKDSVFEKGQEQLYRTESMTSTISDSPSSTGSVCENMLAQKSQDMMDYEERKQPALTEEAEDTLISKIQDLEGTIEINTQENFTQQETEESVLEKCIREETSSDISNESCHNLEQDDLSDCVQVEIAIVSSDSESDDKWRAIFTSSVNKDEADGMFSDNIQETSSQEQPVPMVYDSEEGSVEHEKRPEAEIEDSTDDLMQNEPLPENEFSTQLPNLSKISEDEEETSSSLAKHKSYTINSARANTEKKIPSDYCVIQETKSENVSTEHVDFTVARKQWLKMEEETKQQVLQPTVKQGTCQGGHSLMYTPVRNIEKPKKDTELDSLGLREPSYTQYSPCSEDSGLGDSSYRSPYDDVETPIEREIRLAMEREESLRRERGLPSTTEGLSGRTRPATLLPCRSDKTEERQKMTEAQEDSCRSYRSPSTKTPSFPLASSPSSKSPSYHEMAANNVIILEPDSHSGGHRHCAQTPLTSPELRKFGEWPSETTNIIILETSNLVIRSASEFCLNTVYQDAQESTFLNNPFFKLRSRSTHSLVDQEIKLVKQREEELKQQRAQLYAKQKYDTVLVSPNLKDSLSFDKTDLPVRCKSSPSSPLKTARKMDRSTLSCDCKFTENFSGVRRKSTMAMRWEAGEFANHP
ncbi:uncharacterized protein LOC108935090 [Scleropages formosus]|uniref:Si:ch211-153l6.6 n=1 Tax=Scleropages formosus TaxID=113540 RepID=A0A8C9R893_SCLFO|nr:uncharacterized protein LOC108935090 [Scleropages formosus]